MYRKGYRLNTYPKHGCLVEESSQQARRTFARIVLRCEKHSA